MTDTANNSNATAICDISMTIRPRGYGRSNVAVLHDGRVVYDDLINVESAEQRSEFIEDVFQHLRQRGIERTQTDLELQLSIARSALMWQTHTTRTHCVIESVGPNFGMCRTGPLPIRILNFIPEILMDVTRYDAGEQLRQFVGRIRTAEGSTAWTINVEDYAIDSKLIANLYATGGPNLTFDCNMKELRNAIAEMPPPRREVHTTDFGWTDQNEFLTPGGIISASGWRALGSGELTVNLNEEDFARNLALPPPVPADVERLKRTVVPRLLELSSPRFMLPLFGFLWLPILVRFLPEVRQFCLWLSGVSGLGKSYVARLFQKFYGSFEKPMTWTSTFGSLQRSGYYFRNALALIDDYKPETVNPRDVIKLIQNYADGTARGRLKKDATANWTLPFRGWMIATGEDLPDQSPSALARTIVVPMPRQPCNHEAGRICTAEAEKFSQLTSAFIISLLNEGRGPRFRQNVERFELELRQVLHGCPNEGRIGRNFALLMAGTYETLDFLILDQSLKEQLWRSFCEYVREMIRNLVREITDQVPHEVLLANLRSLMSSGRVNILRGRFDPDQISPSGADNGLRIGQVVRGRDHLVEINLTAALEQVNTSLRQQSKQDIKCTHSALLSAMREANILYNREGELLTSDDDELTTQAGVQVEGRRRNLRHFIIRGSLLGLVSSPSSTGFVGPTGMTTPPT